MNEPVYVGLRLDDVLVVDELFTIHLYEMDSDYKFFGETHDFWELLYVRTGIVEIFAGSQRYLLSEGEVIFHKPLEFHSVANAQNSLSAIFIMSFSSRSDIMKEFNDKITKIGKHELEIIQKIMSLAERVLEISFTLQGFTPLQYKANVPYSTKKLLKITIEQFLIHLLESQEVYDVQNRILYSNYNDYEKSICLKIHEILTDNIYKSVTIKYIAGILCLSPTYVCYLFKKNAGEGIISYFNKLKIQEAKRLLREEKYNITQISEALGYTSVHYFSRVFKKTCDMSPSEYIHSLNNE